jgi:hypothetical protein
MSIHIIHYNFSTDGTQITFSAGRTQTTLSFDAPATCQLLQDIGAIEDFTLDANGEPVVLYTAPAHPLGYGYAHWCDFVKTFPLSRRTAEIILEDRYRTATHHLFQAKVIQMLSPLQAA